MSSEGKRILGRKPCHVCGFEAAHVKQSTGKFAYIHCPSCGCVTHSKTGYQQSLLLKGMKPEPDYRTAQPAEEPAPTKPPATATATAAPPAPPARSKPPALDLFQQLGRVVAARS